VDPDLQEVAAKALRDGLEKYDRSLGVWRGTGKTLRPRLLASEDWRVALAEPRSPRDHRRRGCLPWCWSLGDKRCPHRHRRRRG
jgi:hypothetical protein